MSPHALLAVKVIGGCVAASVAMCGVGVVRVAGRARMLSRRFDALPIDGVLGDVERLRVALSALQVRADELTLALERIAGALTRLSRALEGAMVVLSSVFSGIATIGRVVGAIRFMRR